MTYLPSELINQNYKYSINDATITIYTNCENGSCSCKEVYTLLDYQTSDFFTCSDINIKQIPNTNFTDNFYYRNDLMQILIIFTIFCIFIILGPLKILGRLFKRFEF